VNSSARAFQLESATYRFHTENEGSHIVSIKDGRAIVQLTGLSRKQARWHARMIMYTFGLWMPVYLAVFMLKRPALVQLTIVNDYGDSEVRYL
jgi:hypothetical protein